jgi:hypothetical protein
MSSLAEVIEFDEEVKSSGNRPIVILIISAPSANTSRSTHVGTNESFWQIVLNLIGPGRIFASTRLFKYPSCDCNDAELSLALSSDDGTI